MKSREGNIFGAFSGLLSIASPAIYRRVNDFDFVAKVAETFAIRTVLVAVGLITSVIVARILGPEGRGLYAVAITVGATGVQLGNLGLHASNTYYVAKDRMLLPSLVGNSLLISFAFGGVGAGLAWIAFSLWPRLAPIDGALLGLALTWIPFGLACMLLQNLLLGIQEVRAYNKVELITNIGNVILIGFLVILGIISVESLFLVGLVALIMTLFWTMWRLRSHFASIPEPSLALFKGNIAYGFKAYLAALFSFLVLRVDLLMVKYMLDAEQAGYYSIAAAMADMVYMLPVVTGTILFPKLSAMTDATTKWQFTGRLANRLTLVMFFVAGFAALLAKPMLGLLYGEEFLPAVPAFIWLLPGIVMLSINTIFLNYFAAIGMPPITVYSPVIAVIINIILNLELIPSLGIVGASISSVVAYGIMLIASTVFVYMESKKSNE